jgi:hypothetical protein
MARIIPPPTHPGIEYNHCGWCWIESQQGLRYFYNPDRWHPGPQRPEQLCLRRKGSRLQQLAALVPSDDGPNLQVCLLLQVACPNSCWRSVSCADLDRFSATPQRRCLLLFSLMTPDFSCWAGVVQLRCQTREAGTIGEEKVRRSRHEPRILSEAYRSL